MAGFPKAGDEYGGRYRIVRELGHGGMGIVYEAVDSVLDRAVALKIVLPSLPDREDYQARFAREASVLARIRSRNIVVIHEYGEHEDTVFFVTELFPDGDLQSWLVTHGPLDRRTAVSLTAQVCEALADAHAAGVVHRDVKPGNVLLWNRPEGLIPYLCDFGIALEGGQGRSQLTRTGTLIGSPAYMAPERHFGHAADERGDLYSVGCLLWASLTGDAPYSGTDFQMMNSHINAPVPQLGTGDPVDDRIDEVLASAMNKDPERRAVSAGALRAALLDVVRTIDQVPAPPPPVVPGSRDTSEQPPAAPQHTVIRPRHDTGATPGTPAAAEAPDQTAAASATPPATSDAVPDATPEATPDATPDAALVAGPAAGPGAEGDPAGQPGPASASFPAAARAASSPADPARHAGRPPADRRRRRRSGAVLLAAAAVVGVVAGTAALVHAQRDDERAADAAARQPSGGSSGTPAGDPSATAAAAETTTPAPLARPTPPRVRASPAYRAVRFALDAPRAAKGRTADAVASTQVRTPDGWRDRSTYLLPTEEGGDQGCVQTRTVLTDDAGQRAVSKVSRSCGHAQPRTVRLVRTDDACTAGAGCHWYDVYVTGFASGTAPRAYVYDAAGNPWCACTFRPVEVGKDGRGAQVHEWQVTPGHFNSTVTLDVDGVRQQVFVP